ncbi:sensor histidine kinase [Brevundimonas aveniformis]|uniref:sensor histidine kinase n=1 Tax=Brevundimonas aveniformis TaxID=370977 RepID=UPI0003F864C3|nr:sensor histidine kinase [Brevundimonas aveniformis]
MTTAPAMEPAVVARGSLAGRLIWLAATWSILALALTGLVLTTAFRDTANRRLEGLLQATDIEVAAVTSVQGDYVVTPPVQDARTLRAYSGKYWSVVESNAENGFEALTRSQSLFDYGLPPPTSGASMILAAPGEPYVYDAIGPDDQPLRIMAVARTLPNREAPVIFLSAIDRSEVDQDISNFALLTWTALAVLGVGLIAAVFIQVRVGLNPLYALGTAVADVRRGSLQRLSGTYPTEIAPLAEELNALLDHNQEVVERQRTHVGNLAHALKTPLAVMLAEADGSKGKLADTVRKQAALMRAQVEHHLQRARAAARAQLTYERTAVDEVLDELASLLERAFQSKSIEIDWRSPEGLAFRGERQDLQEILGNLLENACKWGHARIRVEAAPAGPGRLSLRVEDDGPGLPADQHQAVLKRGTRLDEEAPGTGLGLSIVDDLVKSYGGRLELGQSDLGGLRVDLELPATGG